jgi:Domain of unknown function (DUF1906)/Divergent InlB B-repeat domain
LKCDNEYWSGLQESFMRVKKSLCVLRVLLSVFLLLVTGLSSVAWAQADADLDVGNGVQSMKLVGGQSGWMLANNRVFWTSSLGASWTEVTPPSASGAQPRGVFFNAAGSGWIVQAGTDQSGPRAFSVAHSADQGAHWSSTAIASPFTDGLIFGGSAFPYFTDEMHGWVMLSVQSSSNFSRDILFQTVDGGAHWVRLPDPPVDGDVVFSDSQHGFIGPGARGDELFSTADGGQTWQAVPLASPSADLAQTSSRISLPAFSDREHGLLVRTYSNAQGTTSVRYATADGGTTWTAAVPVQSAKAAIFAVTADGGVTAQIVAPAKVSALATGVGAANVAPIRATFSDAMQGWVLFSGGSCQAATCTQSSSLQGTVDGGKTFFALGSIPGVPLESTRSVVISSGAAALRPNVVNPRVVVPPTATPLVNQMGFDKCEILTTTQMQDWITNSPYRAVGAYIGGISAACANLGFTQSWAATVLSQGWGIIPIWVGPQAPNSTLAHKLTGVPATDQATGVTEADAAAARMTALGFGPGSVVYYDMEAYTRTAASEASTQAFVEGWVTELHAQGFQAAIYSSHPEIQDWEQGKVADAPDAIWFAFFFSTGVPCGTKCQNTESTDIPDTFWNNHQRLRQTSSGFTSTYGSTAASIDEDWTDGPVVAIATGNRLIVTTAGTGTGLVTSGDTFISCGTGGSVCSAVYAAGSTVTLTAVPTALSSFISWTGCTTSSGTTCNVTVSSASSVTATFNITPPVFTIASSVPSLTWNVGASAGANITVSPKAPYQGTFTFACSGLPSYLHCAFSPATVTADGSGATLTTAMTLTATSSIGRNNIVPRSSGAPIQLALLFVPLLFAPMVFRRNAAVKRLRVGRLMLLLAAAGGLAVAQFGTGCSDGGTVTKAPLFSGTAQLVVDSAGTNQTLSIPVTVNAQ